MNIEQMIGKLRQERDAIEFAILALQRLAAASGKKRRGRPPAWLKEPKRRGRPPGSKNKPKE